jgi:hypothetical protein
MMALPGLAGIGTLLAFWPGTMVARGNDCLPIGSYIQGWLGADEGQL